LTGRRRPDLHLKSYGQLVLLVAPFPRAEAPIGQRGGGGGGSPAHLGPGAVPGGELLEELGYQF